MPLPDQPDIDDQDQSEVFDEDNYDLQDAASSTERRTFEEMPDVLDVTAAAGDEDDDEALIGEELDDEEIVQLEADQQDADTEDDDLQARMPEGVHGDSERPTEAAEILLDEEAGLDAADRRSDPGGGDEVEMVYAGGMDNFAEGQANPSALEAERLADDDIEALGYAGDEARSSAQDGRPGQAVRFEIRLKDHLWTLTRDGEETHRFSHAERAIHEARQLAETLRGGGQPAQVMLEAAGGKVIEVTEDAPPRDYGADETSAVIPDRSEDA